MQESGKEYYRYYSFFIWQYTIRNDDFRAILKRFDNVKHEINNKYCFEVYYKNLFQSTPMAKQVRNGAWFYFNNGRDDLIAVDITGELADFNSLNGEEKDKKRIFYTELIDRLELYRKLSREIEITYQIDVINPPIEVFWASSLDKQHLDITRFIDSVIKNIEYNFEDLTTTIACRPQKIRTIFNNTSCVGYEIDFDAPLGVLQAEIAALKYVHENIWTQPSNEPKRSLEELTLESFKQRLKDDKTRIPMKTPPRLIGLWLCDLVYKRGISDIEAIRELKETVRLDILGYAATNDRTFHNFLDVTRKCIARRAILPFD